MFELSLKPQGIGTVLGNSFRLYGKSFWKFIGLSLLVALGSLLFSLCDYLFQGQVPHPASQVSQPIGMLVLIFILAIMISLVLLWLMASLISFGGSTMGIMKEVDTNIFQYAFRKFPIYFVTKIVILLILIVSVVLLVIPGIYFMFALAFSFCCILIDGDDVVASIKHSVQLVWGHWWRTFVILLMPIIVNTIILFVINFSLAIIFSTSLNIFYYRLANAIPLIFLLPWTVSVVLCQFHDLKLRYQEK